MRGLPRRFGGLLVDASGGVPQEDFDALAAEVSAARGDRSALDLRISTISNFASPNAGGVIVGQYYDNAFHAQATGVLAGAAGRFDLAPFYTSVPLTIDQIGVAVSTGVGGALIRCAIYGSDSNGWPDGLLFYGGSDLDCSTTGFKFHDMTSSLFTFDSGRQYWLGVHSSSSAAIRRISVNVSPSLGVNGASGTNYFTILRRTVTYASGAPDPWNFVAAERAVVNPPSIRMRAA